MLSIPLLIASFLLATSPLSIASEIECDIPRSFTVNLSYDTKATVSESELVLQTKTDVLYLDTTPGLDTVRILTDKVFVTFKGKAQVYDEHNNTVGEPSEISELFYESLIGEADRSILTPEETEEAWCHIALLPATPRRPITHPWIAEEIYRLTKSCAEREMCSKIRSQYSGIEKGSSTVETRGESAPANQNSSRAACASMELQKTLNMVADMGMAQVIALVKKETGRGGINLPDFATTFDVGSGIFQTTGKIRLWGGKFGGIETLRRKSDAMISHKGLKLTAACEVGLDRAEIEYSNYELRYGVWARGKVTGFVDGINIAMQVSADYDRKPCVTKLDHLKITHFGGVVIEMTGLGVTLDWLVSTISDWVATKYHGSITTAIEQKIRGVVESKLSGLECEDYRVWY